VKRNLKITLKALAVTVSIVTIIWLTEYSYRSLHGSYHEHLTADGNSIAIWYPSDFTERELAPVRSEHAIPSRKRFAPLTKLPSTRSTDLPLLIIDRWIFHSTTALTSSNGDMKTLHTLSPDGRTLTPTP
jgi:hypothetical protein